ncbi:hypothetical protein ACWD33_25980 [Streptomyces xiamenensis]
MDAVVAAVAALRDPSLPGTPWAAAEIAAVLTELAASPVGAACEAETLRWLAAIQDGAPLPD